MDLSEAQKRDLLKAYERNMHYPTDLNGGGLRTGKHLVKKGLVKETVFLPYPSNWQWYAITEEGIKVAKSLQ